MIRLLRARFAFGLLLAAFALSAWAQVAVPELSRRVTDLTATLSAGQVAALEDKLAAFEAKKGSQIAVLIVPTTQPEDIAQFGIRVADQWKIGRKRIDDGVILIVAKDDRRLRLEVGYGLEGAIPDAIAKRVIAETITPYLKKGDFYGGIDAGVQQLMRLIEGEPLPPPAAAGRGGDGGDSGFVVLVVGGMIAGWLLSALMSRPAAGGIAALGSGAVGAMLLGFTPLLLFIAVFVFAGVVGGFRHGGGWSSGGGGWSGGGGGGSWGGGGGGFGGGGASGSW
ncbi:MAG: TPM domain-containing protein [Hyphomicrobiaceae bacterium]